MNWEFIRVYKSDYVNFDITSLALHAETAQKGMPIPLIFYILSIFAI